MSLGLVSLLLALGLVACGGDDEGSDESGVDVAALEACIDEDPATDIVRDDGSILDEEVAAAPTAEFELSESDPDAFPVAAQVLVFPDEESADVGMGELQGNQFFLIGEEGPIRWAVAKTDDRYTNQVDSMISECARDVS